MSYKYRMGGFAYGISKSSIRRRLNSNVGMGASVAPATIPTQEEETNSELLRSKSGDTAFFFSG